MAPLKLNFQRIITYEPNNRLFPAINDLTILMAALSHAMYVVSGSPKTHETIGTMRLREPDLDYALGIPMSGPLEIAMRGDLPDRIDIGIISQSDAKIEPEDHSVRTGGFSSVMLHMTAPLFLGFFERYNDWLDANLGDAANWPPILNFARVVRNSIAHGAIKFRSPGAPPVTWKGFTYSPSDNGKAIVGTDIGPVHLAVLLIEVGEELDKLGVPNL